MGKSFKKNCYIGNCCCYSEKKDKRIANKAFRRRIKTVLKVDPYTETFPVVRELSNVWDFGKDGKNWFGDIPFRRSTLYPHERFFNDPYWVNIYRKMKGK